ncbi:DUF3800 domain-containing protein [Pseudogemmobacter sonorensis]|uniref:DUF3800 domain-containing protein n=1 Tax=Pseudogemmobacter sonorensis TaxID=2989681 RepID=UPI0036BE87CB
MDHDYTLFIDEAGDDKVERLKPDFPEGNSEWLCLGGYLIRAEAESELDRRRDEILLSFGGQVGGVLHYKKLKPKNRTLAAQKLVTPTYAARGFVVCSCKKTMLGYHNARAAAASGEHGDYLYNFVARLLLERVTQYVANAAPKHGVENPVLRIVMASRRGHHFGHFKAYVLQLINQATAGTTYLAPRVIDASVLRYNLIDRAPASQLAGLQLADVMVSAFFQSIEQRSPHHADKVALHLRPLMAEKKVPRGRPASKANEGVTFFPDKQVVHLLTPEQSAFFAHFGYDMAWLKSRKVQKAVQPFKQAERLWSRTMPDPAA